MRRLIAAILILLGGSIFALAAFAWICFILASPPWFFGYSLNAFMIGLLSMVLIPASIALIFYGEKMLKPKKLGYCPKCGYDLRACLKSRICSECGRAF